MTAGKYALMMWLRRQRKSMSQISRVLRVSWSTLDYNLKAGPPALRVRKERKLNRTKTRNIAKRRKFVRKLISARTKMIGSGGVTGNAKKMVVVRQPFPSAPSVARELASEHNVETSSCTVRRDLHNMGFRNLARPSGPRRMLGDIEERLGFCRRYVNNDPAYFMFSDEHIADTNDHVGHRQWCAAGQAPDRREYYNWCPKLHVWGLIGIGVKKLVVFGQGESINADTYKRKCLMPYRTILQRVGYVFMQDGARAHTAASTIRYLEGNTIRFFRDWPARSPDLNPIENLWSYVQGRVSRRGPTDRTALAGFFRQEWEAIPQHVIDELVLTFRARLLKCIANKGNTIN